ncbi:MAG: hypothetical protein EOO75_12295 [Myxococcales bacterium]|nr:MAG: hypothetical protein EOO75_12295 [Myxococcales bacterium]
MILVERNVGRLIEGVVATPIDVAEAEAGVQRIRLTVLSAPARAICCIDATGLKLLPSSVSETFVALFTRDNPRIECSAFLLSRRASGVGLQLDRMLREAGHPARRSFDDRDAMSAWLEPMLTIEERDRLRAFLRSRPAP